MVVDTKNPRRAKARRGSNKNVCGGVLLSHTLPGAVPSPCQALASGFGKGPGVTPGPWPPQKPPPTARTPKTGTPTGQRKPPTRRHRRVPWRSGNRLADARQNAHRHRIRDHSSAHCRLEQSSSRKRRGPTPTHRRGNGLLCRRRPLVPVGSTPRGASTSGLSNTCSTCGLQRFKTVRNPNLGAGFPLRCFQRLSLPNVANRPCRWRDNRHTRGSSTQVLSYYGQASPGFQRAQRIETKLSHDVLNPARVPL